MNYFAYGSNLSSRYLREYCPSASFVQRAFLPNFRVEFRRFSTDMQGGISSIVEAPGEMVHGIIFDVETAEIEALDVLEDVPLGLYRRDTFLVLDDAGQWHHADLYRVVEPKGPFTPAKQYVDLMIEGAMEHGLDPEYVRHLQVLRDSLN